MTTDSVTYRVYEREDDGDALRLLERGGEAPTLVRASGYDAPLQSRVDGLEPGNRVAATLDWTDGDRPSFADLTVETTTRFVFADGTPDVFDQAERTFETARRQREPVASDVTYGTDGEANGVVYTIADQPGERDVFADLRAGRMTLEPMLDKLADGGGEPPYEVFVIRPAAHPFVAVYLTLEREGLLANTVREEYT
ncbi:MAG: DUF6663 family protein [Halorientalis sp.]